MSYIINSKNTAKIKLNETNTVKSVLQNIAILLSTRQFSVPIYREFGLQMEFLDKPIVIAKPLLIADVIDAIAEYEPRATVLNIDFKEDESIPGKLIPIVEVDINE